MSELKFHPKAFSLVWDMPRLTPAEHIAAFEKMLAQWEIDKGAMRLVSERAVIMCGCDNWLECGHPWPQRMAQ